MLCSRLFYHYNVTQLLSIVLLGKSRTKVFDTVPCSCLRKFQFAEKMSLNYIYLVLQTVPTTLLPYITTILKQHSGKTEQATHKEAFNKSLHKGRVSSLLYQGESQRITEQAEFTYITKLLTRSTGNKWSISEDSAKLRRVLTAWQATNRLPGTEREQEQPVYLLSSQWFVFVWSLLIPKWLESKK